MSRFLLPLACSLTLLFQISVRHAFALDTGDQAVDFTLQSQDGTSVSLSSLKGEVIYLDFWASWCGPCQQSFPFMKALQDSFGSRGVKVIAVNLDNDSEQALEFLKKQVPNFTVLFDSEGKVAEHYDLSTMPASFLIDRNGNVARAFSGFRSSDKAEIEAAINKLIEHQEKLT